MSVNIVHPPRIVPSRTRTVPVAALAALLFVLLAPLAVTPVRATIHQQESGTDPDPSRAALPEGVSVNVDASAGVAVLYGRVARPIERLFANRAIRALSDVGHVIDALIVAPESDAATVRSNGLVQAHGFGHALAGDAHRMRR